MKYNFKEIEEKWQKIWEEKQLFKADFDEKKKKYYCLEMFPYPSGKIHMGHVRNYSIGDVIVRLKKMKGMNVLHPMGWDALGLPAENAAIKHKTHPETWTLNNIEMMKKQCKRVGFWYDWDREVATCRPEYYKWNQYIFIKMYEKGLAYKKKSEVNWCPSCKTVLANEQVADGFCWRCDSQVEARELDQWFLKTTQYADELQEAHKELEKWPSKVILMQKNWIGKSKGAGVKFKVADTDLTLDIYTTRLDTIFGSTFFALSVKHPMVTELVKDHPQKEEAEKFIKEVDIETKASREQTEKKGFFTGKYAVNPFNNEKIPIWFANFVLIEYGTGAIMSVPAHDERDFEFAKKYDITIRRVIVEDKNKEHPDEVDEVFTGMGYLVNSGEYSGLTSEDAIQQMGEFLKVNGFGELKTMFRLRDWGVSRQRYWGTPIPMIYCDTCGIVPEAVENLPVELPRDVDFTPEGGSPLEKHESFVKTTCPKCSGPARRETDTMDTFFDSSWYFFRYTGPIQEGPFDKEEAKQWMPPDIYIGGIEHAILHLIYARFFTKVFRDFGWTGVSEPFPHLLTQGMVTLGGSVMSKSRGNVVDPDSMIETYGADTTRLFILFAAPPEKNLEWSEKGVEGAHRFLQRTWNFFFNNREILTKKTGASQFSLNDEVSKKLYIKLNQTIKKVTEDVEVRLQLNTAIAAQMEFFNELSSSREKIRETNPGLMRHAFEILLKLLSPFTPHFSSELWERSGHTNLLEEEQWPAYDPGYVKEESINVMIQINGKIRDKLVVNVDEEKTVVKELAFQSEKVKLYTTNKQIVKTFFIKNKMFSIVVK